MKQINRFTPPTCTLEIKGNKSPLSRWTKQEIFQKIQFKLKFDDPRQPTSKQVTIKGNQQELWQLSKAVNHYAQEQLHTSFKTFKATNTPERSQAETRIQTDSPYLKSQGLVHHQLFFGSLTHDNNFNHIRLSTVQLFDLVTALEAYQAHIATLPDATQNSPQNKKIIPLWGGIAAVAIAGIGITSIIFKSPVPQNIASSPESQPTPAPEINELDEIISPQFPTTVEQPVSQPKLTKPLSSADRLPPPPAVDIPKPKPNIPDPADYPADVAPQSGTNPQQKKNPPEQPTPAKIVIPETEQPDLETIAPEKKIASQPSSEITTTKIETELTPSPQEQQNQIDSTINSELELPPELSVNTAKDEISAQNSDVAVGGSLNSSTPPSQIQEVIAYFENQWQPPANLKQSLEYRLLLNEDGSIKKVVPLGKASGLYLSQTNIPVNGESFMTPPDPTQSSTIRLLLNPDGNVQAFIE